MRVTCICCGKRFDSNGARGRTPKYCSRACQQRAYRARVAKRPRLPEEMREEPRWARTNHGKPLRTSGAQASSINPATWASYEDVIAPGLPGDGIGYMLGGGYGCVVLKDCISESGVTSAAQELIDVNPSAYIEYTVPGNGLQVFGYLPEAVSKTTREIEIHSVAHFIPITSKPYKQGILTDLVLPG